MVQKAEDGVKPGFSLVRSLRSTFLGFPIMNGMR